jgi:hypothetical protein
MGLRSNAVRLCTVLVVLIAVIAERAAACECRIPDICELVESSGVIFLGEVVQGGLDPGEDAWSGRPGWLLCGWSRRIVEFRRAR